MSFILFFQVNSFAQWFIHENIPTTNDLFSITFPSESIGYTVGEGIVLKSTNGGNTWETLNIPYELNASWRSVHFINDTVGFVTGLNGFMKTNNGGMTWDGNETIQNYFTSTYFNTPNSGFLTSDDNNIYSTSDGGENWISDELVTGNSGLTDVYFINEDTGYCIGYQELDWDVYNGKIFKTENGGISWLEVATTSNKLNEIRFFNQNLGIAVGTYGYIATTNDGGNNWDEQNICDTCELTSILFQNDTSILIAGYSPVWIQGDNPQHGVIYHSTDNGVNWDFDQLPFTNPLQSISRNSDFNIFCAGYNGLILQNANYTNINDHNKAFPNKYELSIYPNPTSDIVKINYRLSSQSFVKISITDYTGKEFIQISNNRKNSGTHETIVNLKNKESGIYFCVIMINENRMVHKIIKTNDL